MRNNTKNSESVYKGLHDTRAVGILRDLEIFTKKDAREAINSGVLIKRSRAGSGQSGIGSLTMDKLNAWAFNGGTGEPDDGLKGLDLGAKNCLLRIGVTNKEEALKRLTSGEIRPYINGKGTKGMGVVRFEKLKKYLGV